MVDYDLEKIQSLIDRCTWIWAQTYVTTPHEYIARGRCEISVNEFFYIVNAQRELGIKERWGTYNFPYLYLNGYKYWTMGAPIPETIIINRQKVFKEFDFLEHPIKRIYSESENDAVCQTIIKNFHKPIFECGTGRGDFVLSTKIEPKDYYGVEPSSKALAQFRKDTTGYYKRCSCQSFEEACERWLSNDIVVIALFGTASYLMKEYLTMLSQSGRDYFLMFFKEDYLPEAYRGTHTFNYTKDDLKRMFPSCFLYNHKDYITISSKALEWEKPKPTYTQNELFGV